jgi:glycosyltransferase involved in cell wall biosynthesis
MKKIIVLVPDLNIPGGVANYYKSLKLDTEKDISYFVINKGRPQNVIATVVRLITNYTIFFFKLLKEKYEVVVINPSIDKGKSFHRDLVFVILAKLLNRKAVVFFRGWLDSYEAKIRSSRFKTLLFQISYAKADRFVVLGKIFQDKLIRLGVPSNREFFIETTVANSDYLNELDLRSKLITFEKQMVLLFLSRVEKEKGLYIALDAYKDFKTKFPERKSCFVIAGDGLELPDVKKYAEQLNVPSITFLGNVSAERKKKVLLESHVMILPSIDGDGLPNCILEGMLYGMPIISRVTAGIPEVVHQNINGFITESLEPSTFTDYLSRIANDDKLFFEISENNHRVAMEKFTNEKVRKRIIEILRTT